MEAHLIEHHPWQNPEVIAVPITVGAAEYLRWIDRSAMVGQTLHATEGSSCHRRQMASRPSLGGPGR
ncbi:divalent cation tolerance protein CutA [Streptomyces sp. NPDC048182]|uniref:divalent cation tolerance protein CutA n=1 Tax=Streptomyces sp. NPDC048182 TaxID=3365507 RepID=UPI00371287F1